MLNDNRPARYLITIFLLVLVSLAARTAYSNDSIIKGSSKPFSFKPAPQSVCRSHFISEASLKFRVDNSPPNYQDRHKNNSTYWTADLGYLVNVSPVTGIGGTVFFGADHNGGRFGIRARMRRWLKNGLTLDIAPGLLLNVFDNNVGSFPNLFGSVAIGHRSGISGIIQVDRIAYSGSELVLIEPPSTYRSIYGSQRQTAWYFGISIDGNAGTTAIIIGWVLVALGGISSST